jgi:DNA-binding transcriptional MerR regulator
MLPMLVAQCATVQSRKLEIVKVFAEAGLSLNAVPEAAREYAVDKSEKARLRLRQQAEANAHAERCRVATPRELAQAKADREARAAAIREQSAKVRASSRRNSGW